MKTRIALSILAVLLWSGLASAGTITVHDSTGWVPSGDVRTLSSDAGKWPFDVHLLVESPSSFSVLESDAHAAVTNPNVMVIAIDPVHHKTVTRFGTGTGVKTGDYSSISAAGDANFRSKEIRQGIESIIIRAKASRESITAMSTSNAPVILKQGMSGFEWFAIIMLVAFVVGFLVWLYRKMTRVTSSYESALIDNRLETSELLSRNVENMTYGDSSSTPAAQSAPRAQPARQPSAPSPSYARQAAPAPVYAPAPAPVYAAPVYARPAPYYAPQPMIVNNGNDLLTGVLIGEALAQPRGRDVYIERDVVVREEVVHRRSTVVDDDAGGSSSSWGSSSSSSSSYDNSSSSSSSDSGGSSSSWDSGGSSDSSSSSSDSGSSGDSGGSSDW